MLWCCSAIVILEKPMDVPGYPPNSTRVSEYCKVRTGGNKEPSSEEIIKEIKHKLNVCYGITPVDVTDATADFTL